MGLGHNPDMKQPKFYNPFHDTNFATLEGSFRERNSFALLLDYLSDPGNKTLLWQKMAAAFAWVWLILKSRRIPEPNKSMPMKCRRTLPLIG